MKPDVIYSIHDRRMSHRDKSNPRRKIHFLTTEIWYSNSSRIYSTQFEKIFLQKIDFFKIKTKIFKKSKQCDLRKHFEFARNVLVVVEQKLRYVVCFDAPGGNAKEIP